MSKMNCKRAKLKIALWVGDDLEDQTDEKLRQHVAECPCCRRHWQELQSTLQTLQKVEGNQEQANCESLWPTVATRLSSRRDSFLEDRFNPWMPVLAVSAACLALVLFSSRPPEPNTGPSNFPSPVNSTVQGPVVPVDQQEMIFFDEQQTFQNRRENGFDPVYRPRRQQSGMTLIDNDF